MHRATLPAVIMLTCGCSSGSVQQPAAPVYSAPPPAPAPTPSTASPAPAPQGAAAGDSGHVVRSASAHWRCIDPDCNQDDWLGAVIAWPSWAAYQDNARAGTEGRAVFSELGEPLYPYMGAWADGCEIAVMTGVVLIIEWQRGTDVWREKLLHEGDKYVIHLVPPEDGAMIETVDNGSNFTVVLDNCEPEPLAR